MLKTNKFIVSLACTDRGHRPVYVNRLVETSNYKDLVSSLDEMVNTPLIQERLKLNENWVGPEQSRELQLETDLENID